jgi:hypothetical protein
MNSRSRRFSSSLRISSCSRNRSARSCWCCAIVATTAATVGFDEIAVALGANDDPMTNDACVWVDTGCGSGSLPITHIHNANRNRSVCAAGMYTIGASIGLSYGRTCKQVDQSLKHCGRRVTTTNAYLSMYLPAQFWSRP